MVWIFFLIVFFFILISLLCFCLCSCLSFDFKVCNFCINLLWVEIVGGVNGDVVWIVGVGVGDGKFCIVIGGSGLGWGFFVIV